MNQASYRGFPITSWSLVSALGADLETCVEAIRKGQAQFSPPPPGTPFDTVCGAVSREIAHLDGDLVEFDSWNNRFLRQALLPLEQAVEAARERWGPTRVGICMGSSTASLDEIEKAYAVHAADETPQRGFDVLLHGSSHGMVRVLRRLTGFEGPASVVSNACASGGKTFASAKRWIEADLADAVLVGGADSLCQTTLRGFRSLALLSEEPARPFSRDRRGITIGEGAALALLERSGNGPRLLGTGEGSDAHHMTAPDPEGRGAQAVMQAALVDGGRSAEEVGHVNAHGTGTPFNDSMEGKAIRSVFGSHANPLVVSTKGYVGHTLGAAGAIEAVFALESLMRGWVPASAGADPVDPAIDLLVPTETCNVKLDAVLSNSFGFGGSNVSLLFGAPE